MPEDSIVFISSISIGLGLFFMVTGAVGALRFPDFFTRSHALGVLESLGAPLVILGVIVLHGMTLFSAKLLLLITLLWITGPTATHMVAKAAVLSGLKPKEKETK